MLAISQAISWNGAGRRKPRPDASPPLAERAERRYAFSYHQWGIRELHIRAYLDGLKAGLGGTDAFIPVPMAANVLGVEPTTVRAYLRSGLLAAMKIDAEDDEWSGVSARSLIREVDARRLKIMALVDPMMRDLVQLGGQRVDYSTFMSRHGLSSRNPNHRLLTAQALGEVSTASWDHEVLLTAQVVRRDNQLPSQPFFDLAVDLGAMAEDDDQEVFIRRHLRKIRRVVSTGAFA